MAWALRGASHFPPLAGEQGSGPEAESRPEREEGGTRTPPLPLRGDPGSARVRARAPLAPPIVVQQVELVSRGATCWKGREAPCGGGWEGESESDPVRPGQPRGAEPDSRCPDWIPFYTSRRGSLGNAALQARLEASLTGCLPQLGGSEVQILVPSKPAHTHPKTPRSPSPPESLSESTSRGPSLEETQFLHLGNGQDGSGELERERSSPSRFSIPASPL